jgi:hypothetical protein
MHTDSQKNSFPEHSLFGDIPIRRKTRKYPPCVHMLASAVNGLPLTQIVCVWQGGPLEQISICL